MGVVLGFNRRNVGALVAATAVLAVGYLVVSDPVVQYSAWLTVFAIWMAWFIFTGMEWLRHANF